MERDILDTKIDLEIDRQIDRQIKKQTNIYEREIYYIYIDKERVMRDEKKADR